MVNENELMGGLQAAMQPSGGITYANEAYAPTTRSFYDENRPVDILQGRGGSMGQFQFTPGSAYNLSIGGQHVGTATTEEDYRRLFELAQQELARSGEKAQVTFEDSRARAAGLPQFHVQPKETNPVIDMVLPIAASLLIPGSGALLGAAKAAGGSLASSVLQGRSIEDAALRAAISGGTAFGVGQIPGLSSLGSAPAAKVSGAASGVGGEVAGQAAQQAIGGLADDAIMTVVANRLGSGALGNLTSSAVGAGLSNIGSSLANADPLQQQMELARMQNQYGQPDFGVEMPEVVGIGQRIPQTGVLPGFGGGVAATALPDLTQYITQPPPQQQIQEARPDEEIKVTSTGLKAPNIGASLVAGATSALPSTAYKPLAGDDPIINVTSTPTPDMTLNEVLGAGGGATLGELAQQAMESGQSPSQRVTETAKETPTEQKKGMSTLGKVTGGLALLDALAKLFGGGSRGGSRGPTGLDSLSPVFSAQLPAPGGQFSPQALTQRMPGADTRPAIDYERYGYGPARSFFNYVPETAAERQAFTAAAAPTPRTGVGTLMPGALPGAQPQTGGGINPMLQAGFEQLRAAMPDADDGQLIAFLGTPEGQQKLVEIFEGLGAQPRARGGSMGGEGDSRDSFAVRGPGDGRSDDIPALLSDGEYVIDAETVALLGDGSSKAGAERLDLFRSNVRKHKGRDLAEGKFSVNAKPPERYLSGGRV